MDIWGKGTAAVAQMLKYFFKYFSLSFPPPWAFTLNLLSSSRPLLQQETTSTAIGVLFFLLNQTQGCKTIATPCVYTIYLLYHHPTSLFPFIKEGQLLPFKNTTVCKKRYELETSTLFSKVFPLRMN